MAIVTALGAAMLYALAAVLQHRSAASVPDERSMRVGLIVHLAGRPAWLIGIVADAGAYVLQFVALGHGSLVLVQPLLVPGLLMALPINAALTHRHLNRREWVASGAVVTGLALFLVVASPSEGVATASNKAWMALGATAAVLVLTMLRLSGRPGTVRRACLLAAAAGLVMGVAAALTKATSHLLGTGIGQTLTSWEPYALVACGLLGLLLVQSAFQAGPLRWSLPMLTVVETVAGIAIGALAFSESIRSSPLAILAELLGVAVMALGVFGLGQAPFALG
ncbi:MAG: DMT family transporter, partial [Acidimicrobiales bacterium]